ncbi:DUF6428 family protein [uncultured Roseobacter sp.]|uniref:DUF6428 family protein n=1 Tax=uncultured Roseobacter sp. TaxID=114847 RepID=UPI00261F0684|nr:DUF6428 family protein [uncultured Roseobacter sp.]
MTLADLLSELKALDAGSALVFEASGKPIGAGYHVTELRHSESTGIDCGGTVERWSEARLQLLDGAGNAHMRVEKFVGILEQSLARLPALADVPVMVEFAPENVGLQLLELGQPLARDEGVFVALRAARAICKPAHRSQSSGAAASGCCGASTVQNACCGSHASAAQESACCA